MSSGPLFSFLAELKRRRVFRVAAVYIVAAFAAIQAADVIFPRLELPEWTVTLVVALAIVAFPVAIGLAWAFDIGPAGVVRAEGWRPSAGVPPRRAVAAWVGLGVVVALLGVGAYAMFSGRGRSGDVGARSVAVLPFTNMSGDSTNEYFSDGITEELLGDLAAISGLRVTSRTSVMTYKESPKTLREIASELGVAYVVEGSVRRSDGRVRITAQLIRADRDEHVWAQSYDRDLTDVFAIQTDIAGRIAHALEARLSPREREQLATVPTTNLEAYDLYLKARERWNRATEPDLRTALALLRRAIQLDPGFADAWAVLGRSYTTLANTTGRRELRDSARAALQHALAIDPGVAEAYIGMGYEDLETGRLDEAHDRFTRALELHPGSAAALAGRGIVAFFRGDIGDLLRYARRAVAAEPTNPVYRAYEGLAYYQFEKPDLAIGAMERALSMDPGLEWLNIALAQMYVLGGHVQRARQRLEQLLPTVSDSATVLRTLAWVAILQNDLAEGTDYMDRAAAALPDRTDLMLDRAWTLRTINHDTAESDRLLRIVEDSARSDIARGDNGFRPHQTLAAVASIRGDVDVALRELQLAYDLGYRQFGVATIDPDFSSVTGEPAFDRLRERARRDLDRMWREAQDDDEPR